MVPYTAEKPWSVFHSPYILDHLPNLVRQQAANRLVQKRTHPWGEQSPSWAAWRTVTRHTPKKAHHLLERNGKGGMMSELWGYSKAGNTFQVRTKSTRIKFVPPGYVERFPTPVTTPGPVRVFKWLGMRGRCMDRLPVDIRSRVSESYGVKTTQDWARTMAANHTAYLNLHKMHCPRFGGGLASHALPAEYFRLSAILSAGGWWSSGRASPGR